MAQPQRPNGLTALEVSLAISVIGVALCMFVPPFLARLQLSKFDEVERDLELLTRSVQAYYASPHEVHGQPRRRCLPSSAGPTPESVGAEPVQTDFAAATTRGAPTWAALEFQPERPGRFRYAVAVSHARCGVRGEVGDTLVRIEAEADLDGDGQLSSFRRELVVGEDGLLHDGPVLRVQNRTE